eukprot:TRINITY_DN5426_c1_g1_i1.p1 TRINITY_DN5426_c1_g1~~TRINITY_DN5426_c1_g1_i1.p1  ORF type:complete len:123 (+),score=13.09 TRINITY_DN5426_c1_g1_i1:355-723(+)
MARANSTAAPTRTTLYPTAASDGPSTSAASSSRVPGDGEEIEVAHLTLAPRRKKKSLKWSEDTVDNEHMNKKKSKKCCIFHARRQFGDWSDDDSDCECDGTSDQRDPAAQSHDKQQQRDQAG